MSRGEVLDMLKGGVCNREEVGDAPVSINDDKLMPEQFGSI